MNKKLFSQCFFLIVYTLLLVLAVVRLDSILGFVGTVLSLLSSMGIGVLLAFFLNVPYRFFCRKLESLSVKFADRAKKKKPKEEKPKEKKIRFLRLKKKKAGNGKKTLALLLTYLLFFAVLILVISFVVPQLTESVSEISSNIESYSKNAFTFISDLNDRYLSDFLDVEKLDESFRTLLRNMLEKAGDITTNLISFTTGIFTGISNFIMGLIFSVYFLIGKESIKTGLNRFVHAFLPEEYGQRVVNASRVTADVLADYLVGRAIRASVSGLLTFTIFSIIGFSYPVLLAVLLGLFTILPVFGSVIGCCLSVLLIVAIDPSHILLYAIILVLIPWVTDRLIMPLFHREDIRIPALLILFASSAGVYLAGLLGLLLSVPVATVLYVLVPGLVSYLKKKKGLSSLVGDENSEK